MSTRSTHQLLFRRHSGNPILTAADWPYAVNTVFNPAATTLSDGTTLLLCRVEDRRGHSHLCAARSANGIDDWQIDPDSRLVPQPDGYPEKWGVEDPRITYLEELGRYAVLYTSFSQSGPGVSLALTDDFINYDRQGEILFPANKDAALLSHRIQNKWVLIHRPQIDWNGSADIWLSSSPDLLHWGHHKMIMPARKGGWWDARKIGLSTPPILTDQGWLMLYHGVRVTASNSLYRVGLALFDRDDPGRLLARGDEWIFAPDEPYEIVGDVDKVVFPCGHTLAPDGDTINIYYGSADTSIAVATGSIKSLLNWLSEHGSLDEVEGKKI